MLASIKEKFSDVKESLLTGIEETLAREADEAAEYEAYMALTA